MKIKCGKLVFKIKYDKTWEIPINSKKFTTQYNETDIYYNVNFVDKISKKGEKIVYQKNDILITKNHKNLESRYLIIPDIFYPYAHYEEEDENHINISIPSHLKDQFSVDTMFWSLFALEKQMIKKQSLILHCCYISYKDHAILFSGPSGIGKSTQGYLWERYKNSTTINGDRCLLVKEDENWYVYGWPVCGSSGICINERYKLGTIIFLNQGKENNVIHLEKSKAIKKMVSQLTINYWDKNFINDAISLAENICDKINLYELTCTPDEKAVNTLEVVLKENEIWIL